MKKLVIVRHSKSSWSDPYLSDFDRPLNKRGNRDGGLMAEFLSKRINNVDKLLSSSSKRTRLTSEFFKNKINIKVENYTDKLYHASYDDIIDLSTPVFVTGITNVTEVSAGMGHTVFISNSWLSIEIIIK